MIKLKDLITEIIPGDAFKDGNSIEIAVEKLYYPNKWKTVSFDLQRMRANEVGTNPMINTQKEIRLTSSMKAKIKKIAMNPEDAHFINKDDSNMAKKVIRVIT